MRAQRRFFATLLSISLLTASALAADQKRMPANACLLQYDDQNQTYDRGGARIGTRNTTQDFSCPLVRSNTTNTNGLTALRVNLFKSTSSLFACFATSTDQNGSVLKSVFRSITSTNLTFVDWGSNLNTSSAKGTYGLTCSVVGAQGNASWGDEMYSVDYTEP